MSCVAFRGSKIFLGVLFSKSLTEIIEFGDVPSSDYQKSSGFLEKNNIIAADSDLNSISFALPRILSALTTRGRDSIISIEMKS